MSISFSDLIFYAFGIFVLFLTPGPVWIAIISRSITGGLNGAVPLAAGVAIGDIIWPTLAIAGSAALAASYANLLLYLKYLAVILFIVLGINLINNQNLKVSSQNLQLIKSSELAGFTAGLLVIIGNPKAALFYLGILPGFFNLSRLTITDCIAIALVSSLIPFLGNLALAVMVEKSREIISSAAAVRKLNILSGCLLIFVGLLIFIEAISHHLYSCTI
jgi:threonine/homoserine/homoserine lactone efflux protein